MENRLKESNKLPPKPRKSGAPGAVSVRDLLSNYSSFAATLEKSVKTRNPAKLRILMTALQKNVVTPLRKGEVQPQPVYHLVVSEALICDSFLRISHSRSTAPPEEHHPLWHDYYNLLLCTGLNAAPAYVMTLISTAYSKTTPPNIDLRTLLCLLWEQVDRKGVLHEICSSGMPGMAGNFLAPFFDKKNGCFQLPLEVLEKVGRKGMVKFRKPSLGLGGAVIGRVADRESYVMRKGQNEVSDPLPRDAKEYSVIFRLISTAVQQNTLIEEVSSTLAVWVHNAINGVYKDAEVADFVLILCSGRDCLKAALSAVGIPTKQRFCVHLIEVLKRTKRDICASRFRELLATFDWIKREVLHAEESPSTAEFFFLTSLVEGAEALLPAPDTMENFGSAVWALKILNHSHHKLPTRPGIPATHRFTPLSTLHSSLPLILGGEGCTDLYVLSQITSALVFSREMVVKNFLLHVIKVIFQKGFGDASAQTMTNFARVGKTFDWVDTTRRTSAQVVVLIHEELARRGGEDMRMVSTENLVRFWGAVPGAVGVEEELVRRMQDGRTKCAKDIFEMTRLRGMSDAFSTKLMHAVRLQNLALLPPQQVADLVCTADTLRWVDSRLLTKLQYTVKTARLSKWQMGVATTAFYSLSVLNS